MNENVKQLFYEPDEEFVAMVGEDYLTSILHGNLSKSVIVLSNKRLYQKGKIFQREPNGKFTSFQGNKEVDIKDVTGTSFYEQNNIAALIIGVVAILVFLMNMGSLDARGETFARLAAYGAFILGIWALLTYFFQRRRLFIVEYPGGMMASDARWYSQDELENFQKQIALKK